jgi:NADPH:quinone reductase-like Zn-dependent oxidoreductase
MSAVDVIIRTGDTAAIGHHSSCRRHGDMRALTLVADRQLATSDIPAPPPPGAGEVQIRVRAVALNHIDVWGYRGMAFAMRKLPVIDTEVPIEDVAVALKRMESRQVFGKIVVGF